MEMTRLTRTLDDVDGLVVQRVTNDPPMAAIGHQQNGLGGIAQVDHVPMRIVHLFNGSRRSGGALSAGTACRWSSCCRWSACRWGGACRSSTTRASAASGTTGRSAAASRASGRYRSRTTENIHQLGIRGRARDGVVKHVIRTVAIAYPEIAVGGDRDIGRPVIQARRTAWTRGADPFLVNGRVLRIAHGPNFFAFQRA